MSIIPKKIKKNLKKYCKISCQFQKILYTIYNRFNFLLKITIYCLILYLKFYLLKFFKVIFKKEQKWKRQNFTKLSTN